MGEPMKKSVLLSLLLLGFTFFTGCSYVQNIALEPTDATTADSEKFQNSVINAEDIDIKIEEALKYRVYLGDWKLNVDGDYGLYRMTSLLEYFGSTGITIKDVKGSTITGTIYSIEAAPDARQASIDFEGEVIEGKLTTSYEDLTWENSGTIELIFEDQQISAIVTRDESEVPVAWGIPTGEFTFLAPIKTINIDICDRDYTKFHKLFYQFDGITEKPEIQLLVKDAENPNRYYVLVDYTSNNSQDGSSIAYRYLFELEKNDIYSIEASMQIDSSCIWPIDESLLQSSNLHEDSNNQNEIDLSTHLHYHSDDYGFDFILPDTWEGYSVITDSWTGTYSNEATPNEIGLILSIRYPTWTEESPRQDIPIMIFTYTQWDKLMMNHFSLVDALDKPTMLGMNDSYVFALPYGYNDAQLPGYYEVSDILAENPLVPSEDF